MTRAGTSTAPAVAPAPPAGMATGIGGGGQPQGGNSMAGGMGMMGRMMSANPSAGTQGAEQARKSYAGRAMQPPVAARARTNQRFAYGGAVDNFALDSNSMFSRKAGAVNQNPGQAIDKKALASSMAPAHVGKIAAPATGPLANQIQSGPQQEPMQQSQMGAQNPSTNDFSKLAQKPAQAQNLPALNQRVDRAAVAAPAPGAAPTESKAKQAGQQVIALAGKPALTGPQAASSVGQDGRGGEQQSLSKDKARMDVDQALQPTPPAITVPPQLGEPQPVQAVVAAQPEGLVANQDAFEPIVDNPFVPTLPDNLSTFSVDVDTASYSNVRRYLLQSDQLPPPDAVRIEEMLNYFTYEDAPPPPGSRRSVRRSRRGRPLPVERRSSAGPHRHHGHADPQQRAACRQPRLPDRRLRLDGRANKLPLVKWGLQRLVEQLDARDRSGDRRLRGQLERVPPLDSL